jgi:signal transduction histidine kinase
MAAKGLAPALDALITRRSWVLAGLVILYAVAFPFLRAPLLILVPVAAAALLYHLRGALAASVLAPFVNLLLLAIVFGAPNWNLLFSFRDGFLIGHVAIALVGMIIGYLSGVFEKVFWLSQRLNSQERFLTLSNIILKKILTPDRPERLFNDIANHLTNLFVADYGYIARWDPIQKKAYLVAATHSSDDSSREQELNPDERKMVETVLQTGQVLMIEEGSDSPYTIRSFGLSDHPPRVRSAICLPLVAKDYRFGAAILANESPRPYTSDDRDYAERVGYQITLALWTMRQDEISQQQLNETWTLMQIGQALGETERVGLNVVLQLIVDSARKLIPQAEKTVIHLIDADGKSLVPRAISGFHQNEKTMPYLKMHIGTGVAGQVLRDGITINVADVNTDPRFLQSEMEPSYRSLLVSPVQASGKQLGTISVQSEKPYAFSKHEMELLKSLGIQAAIAIENTRLFEDTQQRLKEVNALYKISWGLASSLDADELIQDVVTLLQQNFGYYHAQIFLLDLANGDLIFKRGSGEIGAKLLEQGFHLPRGLGIVGHVVETTTPFVTNNVNDVVFFYRYPLLPDTQSELATPIKVEGRVVGVLDIHHTPPHRLSAGDLQLMSAVADQLAVALQKASLYTNLQKALQQEQSIRSQLLQSERLALVGRLLASVSHELNNPLQGIQNALFLLKEEGNLSIQGNQDLDIILAETERMAALIERLRSAYRPVGVKDFRPVQLNNLVEDVYALISTHMRHKQIAFEFLPDSDLPDVSGISDQIRQVVLNLFLNAIEVMKPGGCLSIQTRNLRDRKEVLLSVQDSGPGIDPEILPNIFEPFITNKVTGTGLGLTITHDIIHQHHGRIEAENHPEGGAVFKVWLPIDERGAA